MQRKKNTRLVRVWEETFKKIEQIKIDSSPFSRKLHNSEVLDMGIKELEKKIKGKTGKGARF